MGESGGQQRDVEHDFGGPWTEVKLDAISDYLGFFTSALKAKPRPEAPFILWYVDAFAGTGSRTAEHTIGGLFDGTPADVRRVELDGSARRALAIQPPFKHLIFVEKHRKRHAALKGLEDEFPGRNVQVISGDGNAALQRFFAGKPWIDQPNGTGRHRAVVFLDPYSMAVKWATLEALARTGAVDVWYLFPLNAVVRQLAHNFDAIDQAKGDALDEIFGTQNWRAELYNESVEATLFDEIRPGMTRAVTQPQIEAYAKRRLRTLFPFVSDPLPLLNTGGAQLFSLFCVCANRSPIAHDLIDKGVSHVLKKFR